PRSTWIVDRGKRTVIQKKAVSSLFVGEIADDPTENIDPARCRESAPGDIHGRKGIGILGKNRRGAPGEDRYGEDGGPQHCPKYTECRRRWSCPPGQEGGPSETQAISRSNR